MYTIGVDLGGTNIAVGLVDEKHQIVARLATPTNADRPYDEIVKDIALTVQKLIEDNQLGDKVELAGTFCMGKCQQGVCVTVDEEFYSVTPDSALKFFEENVKAKV